MFRKLSQRKAQSTLEYAILIGVIVAGLIAMQTYIKRGFQGKLKDSADSMGEQFSPTGYTYDYTTKTTSSSVEETKNGVSKYTLTNQTTDRNGSESVAGYDKEFWFK